MPKTEVCYLCIELIGSEFDAGGVTLNDPLTVALRSPRLRADAATPALGPVTPMPVQFDCSL